MSSNFAVGEVDDNYSIRLIYPSQNTDTISEKCNITFSQNESLIYYMLWHSNPKESTFYPYKHRYIYWLWCACFWVI